MKKRRRKGKKLLTEPKSERMRTKDVGIERQIYDKYDEHALTMCFCEK